MFRIRRIYDDVLPANRAAVARAQEILRAQFPALSEKDIAKLPEQLRNPLKYRFRSILYVAEGPRGKIQGFSLLLHEPELNFCYLEYISAAERMTGRGIGGALYERLREEAGALETVGIFFESLPDDPALCRDPAILRQNKARLKFYEQYGARPLAGTAYETPVKSEDDNPPYLVWDDLGRGLPLPREQAQGIVRAVLERKYAHLCPQSYIDMVVESLRDDPVRRRDFRYLKPEKVRPVVRSVPADRKIALVVNDKHDIHHVRERGYVEAPVRVRSILREISRLDLFETVKVRRFSEKHLRAVHDESFVDYLKAVCEKMGEKETVYPYVFPIRNVARPPKDRSVRAGYYCIDTFTPLTRNAWLAAKRAVDCALTGARHLLEGQQRLAYALVRPPGHHAEKRTFGGFCYFGNAAVAAHHLSDHGRVAVLDIDYHHGNGTQDIFYERSDVLTVSIHGHPRFAYPYFSGFEDEKGSGAGRGYNLNLPLPEQLDGAGHRKALERALRRIARHKPQFLVVALGLDTAKGDPTGTWNLLADDFQENGRLIGRMALPTLVVQEGGYDSRVLGVNARRFFMGLWEGMYGKA